MAIFQKKTPMQKLEAELSALTARAALLVAKRANAKGAFDSAVAARDIHMRQGNLDDEKIGAKLQAAVDSAGSALAGFDNVIAAQAALIVDAEEKLAVERMTVERKAASESLAANIDTIEKQLGPWLAMTRDLAADTTAVGHVSFETDQIGAYLRNAAGEIEIAMAMAIRDLRASVAAIAGGHQTIPRAPHVAAPALAPPKPVTIRLFALKGVQWIDTEGRQRRVGKWNDVDLPEKAAAFALKKGICIELTDPRRKQLHGMSPGHPAAHWCENLDDETDAGADATDPATRSEPVIHSAFEVVDRGRPYVLKTAPGNPEAA
jgi:hypothetical protein